MMGFGQQGMSQSQGSAFRACTLCRVDIRVSYFVLLYLGFQVFQAFEQYQHSGWKWTLFGLAMAVVQFLLLYLTVLVHEFGHGTMSRYLGGQIDHILLWPFGGICFSSRPEERDVRQLVKNDFKVVAAGPATHIPQVLFWAVFASLMVAIINATSACAGESTRGLTYRDGMWFADGPVYDGCFPCSGVECVKVFVNPFNRNWAYAPLLQRRHLGLFLFYYAPLMAIELNMALFAFNVFFPMYPADGAKLLTSILMYCCNVRPYRAAGVLIACSGTCACILITWAVYSFQKGIHGAFGGGGVGGMSGLSAFSGMLPGLLGLMALQETCNIHNLRERNQLSQHPCFRAARTDISRARDEHGQVATLNFTGQDNPNQAFGNTSGLEDPGCCLMRCFSCPRQQRLGVATEISTQNAVRPEDPAAAQRMREDRGRFLENLQTRPGR